MMGERCWERTLEEGIETLATYLSAGPDEVARLTAELATLRRKGNAYDSIAGILRGAIPRILAAMQEAEYHEKPRHD